MNDKNTQRRNKRERVGAREREPHQFACVVHIVFGATRLIQANPRRGSCGRQYLVAAGKARLGVARRRQLVWASQVATVERRHVLILNGTALGNDRRPDRDAVEAYGIMMKPPPLVAVLPPPPPPAPPSPSPSPSPTATATAPSGVKPSSRSGRALLPIWVLGCRHI